MIGEIRAAGANRCRECGAAGAVVDTRGDKTTEGITYRRRECQDCGHRWTTHEVVAGERGCPVAWNRQQRRARAVKAAAERLLETYSGAAAEDASHA